MRRRLLFATFLTTILGVPVAGQSKNDPSARHAFFESKIRPVLVEHCYECHSAKSKILRAGLRLDTKQGLRTGGDSGPAVVPGNVEESLLLQALRYESWEMPPKEKLPDSVIADFERWIEMGADDPREDFGLPANTSAEKEELWSLRPLQRPAVPEVGDASWSAGAIDRFIARQLQSEGLEPAPRAKPAELIRRLYFDLVGLPPHPDAVLAFEEDPSDAAYERIVDSLLSSHQFGERWGRHWLDVARFAESSGGGRSLLFRDAWRYRDYVIRAFNQDKPFDRFISEQIAGDLLPPAESLEAQRDQLIATGFLLLGPINYELQDKELLRMEVIDEQIDTIGRAFLAMTIGCARCHDHKFDPIPTRDYYALAGIFRSTRSLVPGNVSGFFTRELPTEPEIARAAAEHRAKVQAIEKELAPLNQRLKELQGTSIRKAADLPGIVLDDTQAKYAGNWKVSKSIATYVNDGYRTDDPSDSGKKSATFTVRVPVSGEYEVRLAYSPSSNRASNVPVKVVHSKGEHRLRIDQRQPPDVDGLFHRVGRFTFEADRDAVVQFTTDGANGRVIVDAIQFLPVDEAEQAAGPASIVASASMKKEIARLTKQAKELENRLRKLKNDAPAPIPVAMSVQDYDDQELGDFFVCIRGNVHNLGERVPRGFLQAAGIQGPSVPPDQSGRRQLAEWIAHPDHPLTTRVYCNRVWHWLMGAGLCRTPDNFGHMGQPASHPELLDWLALHFQDNGWSTKRLIRTIVCSRTYRQSSQASERALRLDPDNELFSRQNRRRLEAEQIRDAILFISGDLDTAAGGPSFAPNAKEFGYQFPTTRRSIYVPVFRNEIHEIFDIFDGANPNLVTGRRNASTLATQALFLMNSPFMIEQSAKAADRLLDQPSEYRLEWAYRQVLGRSPHPQERTLCEQALKDWGMSEREAWARIFQVLFASVDFRYAG